MKVNYRYCSRLQPAMSWPLQAVFVLSVFSVNLYKITSSYLGFWQQPANLSKFGRSCFETCIRQMSSPYFSSSVHRVTEKNCKSWCAETHPSFCVLAFTILFHGSMNSRGKIGTACVVYIQDVDLGINQNGGVYDNGRQLLQLICERVLNLSQMTPDGRFFVINVASCLPT